MGVSHIVVKKGERGVDSWRMAYICLSRGGYFQRRRVDFFCFWGGGGHINV